MLVYSYNNDDHAAPSVAEVAVRLPAGARGVRRYRVDDGENNVGARWRELGAPAYLSRAQTREGVEQSVYLLLENINEFDNLSY